MKWYENLKIVKNEDQILFFEDLALSEIQNHLFESSLLLDFPFLMEKDHVDDLYLWLTTYLEGREYNKKELNGWIKKFSIIRQKRLNGGF